MDKAKTTIKLILCGLPAILLILSVYLIKYNRIKELNCGYCKYDPVLSQCYRSICHDYDY